MADDERQTDQECKCVSCGNNDKGDCQEDSCTYDNCPDKNGD